MKARAKVSPPRRLFCCSDKAKLAVAAVARLFRGGGVCISCGATVEQNPQV